MLYGSSILTHYELCGHTAHRVWVDILKKKWLPSPPSFSLHKQTHNTHVILLVLVHSESNEKQIDLISVWF